MTSPVKIELCDNINERNDLHNIEAIFRTSNRSSEWYTAVPNEQQEFGIDEIRDVTAHILSSQSLSSSDEMSLPSNYFSCSPVSSGVHIDSSNSSSSDEADVETETFTEAAEQVIPSEGNVNPPSKHYRKSALSVKKVRTITAASTSESTNSDSSIQSYKSSQAKKRGGWPKGRKRKPDVSAIRPPKAPSTGYTFYLNDKRKLYKNLPVQEVTKLIGNEWSRLDPSKKKIYLDKAEIDKKRYREELKVYRKSDAYQTFLSWKRVKNLQLIGANGSDADATDEIDDAEEIDDGELYCKVCDQWFVSFHNKNEHLNGKQHFETVMRKWKKPLRTSNYGSSSSCPNSQDESSLDAAPISTKSDWKYKPFQCSLEDEKSSEASLLNESINSIFEANNAVDIFTKYCSERENEVVKLRVRTEYLKNEVEARKSLLMELSAKRLELLNTVGIEKQVENQQQRQLANYLNIVSLYCKI